MPSNVQQMAEQDENGDISFNYDPSATEGFTLLNTGYYNGVIEDCPVKKKANDPNAVPYLAVKFRADPQPGRERGRVVFDNASFKAQWKLTQLMAAVFGKQEAGEKKLNPSELQGAAVVVYVIQQDDTRPGHTGEKQNAIGRYVPLDEAGTVQLYDWAEELGTGDAEAEPAAEQAPGTDWGSLPGAEEPVVDAIHNPQNEAELAAAVAAENAETEIPFEDEEEGTSTPAAPAAPAARPAAAKKAAAKKSAPARRR